MGYKRPRAAAHAAIKWRSFRLDHEQLFELAGLPGLLTDRQQFDYFLMHSYLPMPGEGVTSSAFDVDELDPDQQATLGKLVALYVEIFGDPGIDTKMKLLVSR